MIHATIAEIVEGIRIRKFSPFEVVEAYLRRAQESHQTLNAFTFIDAEHALRQARTAETTLFRGESLGPLYGVPLTVKSCIDVTGWPCAAGSLLRKDYIAEVDAPLVARLRTAGAILLGNTNTPEFLMAYETNHLLHGKTSNPWNLAYSSGGSSGGEAAAIAAGCSAGGVGSDGGGSIRVPAHFCGICGLKPTPGRIPSTGHFPSGGGAFPWLGVVGPMARTIGDVRALFQTMAGPDAGDALSAPVTAQSIFRSDLAHLRIGILESEALGKTTPETLEAVKCAAQLLEERGFKIEPSRIQELDRALELWWFFFGPMIAHLFRKSVAGHENAISPMFKEYLSVAGAGDSPSLDSFLAACAERDTLRAKILRQMKDVPVLLSPVCSAPAFRHGEGNWQPGTGYRDTMRHSQWLNLTGLPGLSVPVSFSQEGLPIGVQLIGRPYEEELLLAIGAELEEARGAWKAPL